MEIRNFIDPWIKVKAPADKGPKTIRIFINQPNTLDFDKADSMTSTQVGFTSGQESRSSGCVSNTGDW